ncbi:MAG: hypothetical protein ACMVY4_02900 [Minwuia sp.]|uniref:hypothetical protein n=1 Tax=Minwuia sp. TaxID=2493630 RepID=UPI003A842131
MTMVFMQFSPAGAVLATLTTFSIVAAIFFVGWKARSFSWTYVGYFEAGGRLSSDTTENAFWGTSFSFANGIAYFAVLGYYFGLSVVWFQIPWVLSILLLASYLPKLARAAKGRTLHGYLGFVFGKNVRILTSMVSILGMILIFGYEISISLQIIVSAIGQQDVWWPLVVLSALLVAVYCDIGGLAAAAKTDRIQNRLASLALLLILFGMLILSNSHLEAGGRGDVLWAFPNFDEWTSSLLSVGDLPTPLIIGVVTFALLFNLVDMSNWQVISGNSALNSEELKSAQWGMRRAAMWVLILPGFIGASIGFIWSGVPVEDPNIIIGQAISEIFQHVGAVAGIFLGLIIGGLICAMLSTADSALTAVGYTLALDVIDVPNSRPKDESAQQKEDRERSVLSSIRRCQYAFAIFGVAIYVIAILYLPNTVQTLFVFQFVIAAIALAMAPPLIWAILTGKGLSEDDNTPESINRLKEVAFWAVLGGVFAGLLLFIYQITSGPDVEVYGWTPVVSVATSGVILGVGLLKKAVET